MQQYPVGNYRDANKSTQGKSLGLKTIITSSQPKIPAHLVKIAEVIDCYKNSPQSVLIKRLNPIIRGWSDYYSALVSKKIFQK
ncbi:group II intron maturase-specific domain-containing protein [Microcoleus sp. K1-B1]|uniref:group II intron maturase-specific domain-containing protein n=1 Tax=Microcoleus sp. K1-B1 TaxID=2818782 RepID=UPI002FD7059F